MYTVHFMINYQTLYWKIAKTAHFCNETKIKMAVMTIIFLYFNLFQLVANAKFLILFYCFKV